MPVLIFVEFQSVSGVFLKCVWLAQQTDDFHEMSFDDIVEVFIQVAISAIAEQMIEARGHTSEIDARGRCEVSLALTEQHRDIDAVENELPFLIDFNFHPGLGLVVADFEFFSDHPQINFAQGHHLGDIHFCDKVQKCALFGPLTFLIQLVSQFFEFIGDFTEELWIAARLFLDDGFYILATIEKQLGAQRD